MIPEVKTLIFDLDDTLVVEEASAEAAFIETGELAQIRYGLDPGELHKTLRKTCREIWYASPSHPYCKRVGISSWEGLWAKFTGIDPNLKALHEWAPSYRFNSWRIALQKHGIEDTELAGELAETFPRLRRKKNVVYQDTIKTLELLRQNFSMGLLTNGAPDLQWTKIEGAGLAGYFDQVLISGDIGIGKPDRRIFEMLIERLNCSAQTTIMIGNNLITDVRGAHESELRAAWINRAGDTCDDSIIPEWEVSSLDDLCKLLSAGY
jgi:putative hydrolase of the HAD superfamily